MRDVLLVVVVLVVVVTWENKVNSYSDQLKLGQVCKFGVEFDKKHNIRGCSYIMSYRLGVGWGGGDGKLKIEIPWPYRPQTVCTLGNHISILSNSTPNLQT